MFRAGAAGDFIHHSRKKGWINNAFRKTYEFPGFPLVSARQRTFIAAHLTWPAGLAMLAPRRRPVTSSIKYMSRLGTPAPNRSLRDRSYAKFFGLLAGYFPVPYARSTFAPLTPRFQISFRRQPHRRKKRSVRQRERILTPRYCLALHRAGRVADVWKLPWTLIGVRLNSRPDGV